MESGSAEDFVTRLRNLIKSTGLSNYRISIATGISYQVIGKYCNGRSAPGMEHLIKLADYFAVPLDYLTGRCSHEEAKAIADNYPSCFMALRRAPYEAYLVGRKNYIPQDKIGESPWPYNLMDDIFGEEWSEPLDDDQIAGIETAIGELTEREQDSVLSYYRDGLTLENIGKNKGVTRERERQIIKKAVRKLRAPNRKSLMMHGVNGTEERSRITHYRHEMEKDAAALAEYEKQLTEKKAQLFDAHIKALVIPDVSLQMPLYEMDLSTRSFHCLYRCGCRVMGDVLNVVKSGKIRDVRNLGRKGSEEILEKIFLLTGKRFAETGEEMQDWPWEFVKSP